MSTPESNSSRPKPKRIPLWLKLVFTAFMAVLVPVYTVNYGVTNFLWFCDVALLLTLVGLWREDRLLISIASVAIILPQILWVVDFAYGLATGGGTLISLAAYMFNPDTNIYLRGLSLFHGWLPFLLIYAVWRLGYDKRALKIQVVLAAVVLVATFLALPIPDGKPSELDLGIYKAGNVNKVLGWDDSSLPQTTMHPLAWLGVLIAAYPLCLYVPGHLILSRVVPEPGLETVSDPKAAPVIAS